MLKRVVNFGYLEFEDLNSVYTCIRCLHGLTLLDKTLTIRANDSVKNFHKKWK